MSKLDAAKARLDAALDDLVKTAEPLAREKATLAELTKERDELLVRLAELEEESRSLLSTNEDIEGRLDDAIGDIRAALGR